jgi:hypothetical protein
MCFAPRFPARLGDGEKDSESESGEKGKKKLQAN